MSLPVIIAENQTAGELFLTRLGLRVPASGPLVLTDFAHLHEIWEDESLYAFVVAGDILFSLGGGERTLTQGESTRLFGLPKAPVTGVVQAVSEANQTLSGTTTLDGVVLAAGDRVLLAGQTDPTENGIWVVQGGSWTRPTDWSTGMGTGVMVPVATGGTSYGGQVWIAGPGGVGDSTTFQQVSSQDGQQREITSLKLMWKTAVSTQYTEFTYNGSQDLSQVDIWDSSGKTTKLFTRVLVYNASKDLTQVVTTDEVAGRVLTTSFTYGPGKDLETRTEIVT